MRTLARSLILLCLAAFLNALALAQEDYSKVEIKTDKLSETTYMMVGAGGNFDDAWGKGFLPPAKFVEMVWKNLQK